MANVIEAVKGEREGQSEFRDRLLNAATNDSDPMLHPVTGERK
jgi:hypothetical protein